VRHRIVIGVVVIATALAAFVFWMRPNDRLTLGEHHARVGDIDFWYAVRGHGPLVVVQAPGWGIGSDYLQGGLVPLEEHFTLVYYDTRGSGKSADEKRMSTKDMVEDLEQLRAYWKIDSITLVGHSHGGSIALGYAIHHPEHVTKLILLDAEITDYDSAELVKKEIEARAGDDRFKEAIAEVSKTDPPKTDEEFGAHLQRISPLFFYDPATGVPALNKTMHDTHPSAWVQNTITAAEQKPSIEEDGRMNQVRAKTFIVVGRNDWICPVAVSERIHAGIPGSTLVVLEKSGHFPWIEAPNDFFARVTELAR
jgi:pimeloyl-ACP methyl ester carboxylesterase